MSADRPLLCWLHVGDATFAVRELEGRETISTPFRLDLRFALDGGLPEEPEELVQRGALVELARGGERVRGVAGVVTEVSASASIRGVSEVHVVVEPQLALLRHRSDFRVFRDKSAPEIVAEVLATAGIRASAEGPSGLALRLTRTYEKRPYCVQCREADLDFVHRLLEDEGIFYYFTEHDGLVLGDSPGAYAPVAGPQILPFRGGLGLSGHDEDAVTAIARRARVSVGKVSLKDFDLEHPSLDLSVSAAGPTPGGPELYDYPGEYADPKQGAHKAQLIAESLACAAASFAGESLSGHLTPGHAVGIEGAPGGVGEGRHVLTAVTYAWKRADAGFSCAFESLDAATTYRPLRRTPSPQLVNPLTGIVTGPAGQDIHTDALGRVKVHFPWDRLQAHDDGCSDWIPVLQDNTGHSVAIPRVGWEVLVHFLEGDPDRPIVLGRLYNGEDKFPNELPRDRTKSALKSLSSPGRNGTNQIELDDLAGQEKVTVLAELDQNIVVVHDKDAKILHDEQITVVRDEDVEITHDQTVTVSGKVTYSVERDQTRAVGGSRRRKIDKAETSTVTGDRRLTIGGMHQRKVGTDDIVQAKDLTERIGLANLEAFVKTNTTTSGTLQTLTVGGALIEIAKDGKSESTSKLRAETVGGLLYTQAGDGISTKVAKARIVTIGGFMTVMSQGPILVDATARVRFMVGAGTLEAQSVLLKVGETFVLLKDGVAVINAAKIFRLDADDKNTLGSPGIAIIPAAAAKLAADESKAGGQAGSASGSGKTGSGSVSASGSIEKSAALEGAAPKGPSSPLEALKNAVQAGLKLDPKHAPGSLMETLRSYAADLGIRQGTDGQAIPLSGLAGDMAQVLKERANDYVAARLRGSNNTAALRSAGLAWENVTAGAASLLAAGGDLVIAGLASPREAAHVATVVARDGQTPDTIPRYPFVAGGGSEGKASRGDLTSSEIWGEQHRDEVGYYRFLAPEGGAESTAGLRGASEGNDNAGR